MFLVGSCKVLNISNSFINFPKDDEVIKCEKITLINTKVYIRVFNGELFGNVRRAKLINTQIKESLFTMFSNKLTELICAKNLIYQ